MNKPGYYSCGQFAKMAHITKKTVRYYDERNLLKPSYVTSSGARFYTDADFARLQQILLLKHLGFSLDEIREMTMNHADYHYLADSLSLQLQLVEDRIEQMQSVAAAIRDTQNVLQKEQTIDWNRMLRLIHLTEMEESMKKQYLDASNISARIRLHRLYAQNREPWFSWIYRNCHLHSGMHVLEIGCGDGTLWTDHLSVLPEHMHIVVSDRSNGMLRDARRRIGTQDGCFSFECFDCHQIPYPEDCFDLVIANHVLFYCKDIPQVCREICRVLKPGGRFICSTYGRNHMKEIGELAALFDDRIVLSGDRLFERFGRENGADILNACFTNVNWHPYEDALIVTDAGPLISYILSCHGNQKQYILNRYKDFCADVKKRTDSGFYITKEAGIFIGTKEIPAPKI